MSSYGENPKSQFLRTSSMDSIRNKKQDVKHSISSGKDIAQVAMAEDV